MSRATRQLIQVDANFRDIPISDTYLAFRGDYTGTNLIYAGFARPGTAESDVKWQLRKLTYDGSNNLTKVEWPQNSAGGVSADFEFSWTDRTSYVYS